MSQRTLVAGLEKSLEWHQKELEIRGKVMGLTHPITKRTREDVYIILDRLGRLPVTRGPRHSSTSFSIA